MITSSLHIKSTLFDTNVFDAGTLEVKSWPNVHLLGCSKDLTWRIVNCLKLGLTAK